MIHDFTTDCKAYNKNRYTRERFSLTKCPKCRAIGRFTLHGSYFRHVIYLNDGELLHNTLCIKIIRCKSCRSTHAILPRDIIPYRLLALSAVVFTLYKRLIEGKPVLRIAVGLDFSHQFVYSVIHTFGRFQKHLTLFFKGLNPKDTTATTRAELFSRIIAFKPLFGFQFLYMKSNIRPCFMCKFFDTIAPPYISSVPPPWLPGEPPI